MQVDEGMQIDGVPPPPKADASASLDAARTMEEIRSLGLTGHVADLETLGYTVVPPTTAGTTDLVEPLCEAVLEMEHRRTGVTPDVEGGTTHPMQVPVPYVIFDDPIFEEAMLNPVGLALADHLVGRSCILNLTNAFVKGPTEHPERHPFSLHSDTFGVPAPLPPYSLYANVTWALTDYTLDNGALAIVPGSHHFRRHPLDTERPIVGPTANPDAVAVEAQAGSIIVWHGNTWHGSFPRTAPGLRLTLVFAFSRMYLQTQERIRERTTPEMLERHDRRFARLMGQTSPFGYPDEGPEFEKIPALYRAQRSIYS